MATQQQFNASHEAHKLRLLIVQGLRTKNPQIIDFVYKNVFPLYEIAVRAAFEDLDPYLVMRLRQELVN